MTHHLPSAEALEAVHSFPCVFHVKAFGPNTAAFTEAVTDAGRSIATSSAAVSFSERASGGGKHVCVTISLDAHNATQVRALYTLLLAVPGLRMLL